MIIKISNLSEGVHKFIFAEAVENIGLVEDFTGNIKADVELSKAPSQIILKVNLSVMAKFVCDRCALDFMPILTNSYKMVYLYGSPPEENDSLNLVYIHTDTDRINISSDVRDYAILAIPMKKLCKEDCKGLCYKCGQNLNERECGCTQSVDIRWQPLLEIKKKLDNIN
ncbi:MAG: DUF177 domain-containing protein [Ignavibacteria bacterium]|nr:DUF177 domain-containing protein [Ignavibacteria bacterium]